MRRFAAMIAAGSLSALMALTSTAPVQAMSIQLPASVAGAGDAGAAVETVGWHGDRRGWDHRHGYRDDWRDRRYHHRHHSNGAAIIGGLAAGVIIGSAIANSNNHRYYYHNGRRYLRD